MSEDKKITDKIESAKKPLKDIDYSTVVLNGPLYVDPKYYKPGFKYCLPTNRPGEIAYFQRLGWEVVKDDSGDVCTGLDKPSQSSPLGTAVTIASKCGATHVLMEIPEELHAKFMKFMSDKNNQRMAALGHVDGIAPNLQYGSVDIQHKNRG